MRVRKRAHMRVKNLVVLALALCPLSFIGAYFGVFGAIAADLTSFSYTNMPDPAADFTPLESIDAHLLALDADTIEWRMEAFHIPLNLTVGANFNASNGVLLSYGGTDNGALWTGTALAAEAMRYSVLQDGSAAKANSSRLLHKLVEGFANLLRIPNGGLGPEYPGILARYYAAPEHRQIASWMFTENYKHFNGTGPYSQWRVRLYTSKDEIGGYLMGIAATQHFVKDDQWITETMNLIIAQLVNGFLDTFWQEIHGDGTPCGAHLQPLLGSGTEWKLLAMKLAVNAYPDNAEYRRLYDYYAAKDLHVVNANDNNDFNTLDEYYGYNFGTDVFFALALAEDNPVLREKYIRTYEDTYRIWANHRNAWFNAIYLAMCALRPGTTPKYDTASIKWDVLDQLWRLHAAGRVPLDNSHGGRGKATARADLGGNWLNVDPKIAQWQTFFYNTTIGSWFKWIPNQMFPGLLKTRYVKAARADMYGEDSFFWGNNPYTEAGGDKGVKYGTNGEVTEDSGTAFTAPYWALRAFGYITDTKVA